MDEYSNEDNLILGPGNFTKRVLKEPVEDKPLYNLHESGGGGGIRTLGGLSPSLVFKTSAFDHSATPPRYGGESYYNPCHSQQGI